MSGVPEKRGPSPRASSFYPRPHNLCICKPLLSSLSAGPCSQLRCDLHPQVLVPGHADSQAPMSFLIVSFPPIGDLVWRFGGWDVVSHLPSARTRPPTLQATNPNHQLEGNGCSYGQRPLRINCRCFSLSALDGSQHDIFVSLMSKDFEI